MPDIVSKRETFILVTDRNGLYPANDIYPSDDLFPKDAGFTQITNIVAGSLKLDEKISEKIPQFGQIFASKFECKVYLADDLSNKIIQVYQLDDNVYKPIFVGTIDSCKLDKIGTDRKIVAYDYAYTIGQINIASWWTQFWNSRWNPSTEDYTPATLKECRDNMLTWAGVFYENVSLPNDNLQIVKTVDLTNCSLSNMLKMMCEISYCFPHFDRNGELVFIMLNTDPQQTLDLRGMYEWNKSDFEEFVTSPIDGVQFYDSGNELKYTIGTATNAYPIKQNIFLYNQGTQVLINIGNDLLSYLEDFQYTPSKLTMIASDLEYSLGDFVHTEKGNFYILQNTMSGSQLFEQQLKADGQPLLYGATPRMNYGEIVLNEKIARVGYDLDTFKIEYADYKEQVSAEFIVTARSITSMVSKTQQEWVWNTTTYPVSLYGYHQPGTADFTRYENYVAKNYQNKYYLDQTTGRIYKSEGSGSNWNWVYKYQCVAANQQLQSSIEQTASSIISTVSKTQKEWDTTGYTIDIYGYQAPGVAGYPAASYNGKYYLNQTDGKIYRSNGSSWVLQKSCASIQSWAQSQITQTSQAITSEVSRASAAEGTLSSRITQEAGRITSEITRAQGAEGTLSSRITQNADSISSEITRAQGAEGTLSSRITQNANAIELRVEKNGVISSINQSSEAITINANKVNLTGYVTATSLQSGGSTVIDGSRIQTGVITSITPSASFSINMTNGEVIMNNAKFNGTITGSTIQSARDVGDPNSSTRVVMDNTSTIKGYDGVNPYNWINMMQSGGTHHMIIDAAESLDIAVHQLFVSEDTTHGTGGASAYKGRTDDYNAYHDEALDTGRSCYRICDVRKYMPGEFDPQTAQQLKLGEYTLNAPWGGTALITLPVYLKIRYMNERRIHGFVIDNGVEPINIPHFDI